MEVRAVNVTEWYYNISSNEVVSMVSSNESSMKSKFSVLFYIIKIKKNKRLNLCSINLKT